MSNLLILRVVAKLCQTALCSADPNSICRGSKLATAGKKLETSLA